MVSVWILETINKCDDILSVICPITKRSFIYLIA
jgi:hypothetical protein